VAIAQLLRSYLQEGNFRVWLSSLKKAVYVPQKPLLSGNLFILAINGFISLVSFLLKTILYADDLSVHFEPTSNNMHKDAYKRLST